MPSSLTDISAYRTACKEAATNEAAFSQFKRDPRYTDVLEHVSKPLGDEYLKHIVPSSLWNEEMIEKYSKNDSLGNPVTFEFMPWGSWSPTTLRYIKQALEIRKIFGDLSEKNIVEIGGGYGGLCKILFDIFPDIESYTIIDLEPAVQLDGKYLSTLFEQEVRKEKDYLWVVGKVRLIAIDQAPRKWENLCDKIDLVISNYAFSECVEDIQNKYCNDIFSKSPAGYLTINSLVIDSVKSKKTLSEKITSYFQEVDIKIEDENPLSGEGNYLLTWK
jgi:putative sugar O-methyltransferase